jgi:hypothetical protein
MFIDASHYEAHEENLSPAKARRRQAEIVFDEGEILFSELRVFASLRDTFFCIRCILCG